MIFVFFVNLCSLALSLSLFLIYAASSLLLIISFLFFHSLIFSSLTTLLQYLNCYFDKITRFNFLHHVRTHPSFAIFAGLFQGLFSRLHYVFPL